jgi:hypothetical protein
VAWLAGATAISQPTLFCHHPETTKAVGGKALQSF